MYPDYISAINRLDYNVGRLVEKLKELGIYDDTIIITHLTTAVILKQEIRNTKEAATKAQLTLL